MAYQCDNHPDTAAAVLITNLDNGDVIALCGGECLPAWASAMDAALNGQASAEQIAAEAGGTTAAGDQLDGGITTTTGEDGRVDNDHGGPAPAEDSEAEAGASVSSSA